MSVRVIPKQETIICDRCGAEANSNGICGNPFYFGKMHMVCTDRTTNSLGDSAGMTNHYDLCFECMKTFFKWMNK